MTVLDILCDIQIAAAAIILPVLFNTPPAIGRRHRAPSRPQKSDRSPQTVATTEATPK